MKHLIVALGNPGPEYENTRHNAGFMVADQLVLDLQLDYASVRHGWMAQTKHRGKPLLILKPNTFMNLSGKALSYWMQKEKLGLQQVLVVVDELAIPFGSLRLRGKGSNAGHNGLKDIESRIGAAYPRLRFGIGGDYPQGQQVRYVLDTFTDQEQQELPQLVKTAAEACLHWVGHGLVSTMNKFNTK